MTTDGETVMIHRRELLQAAMTAGAVSVLQRESAQAAEPPPSSIVDTNISLFQWPFRRLPLDNLDEMLRKIRSLGITQAWAGSFEGLLHRDIRGVNERLVAACKPHRELVPIGSINPELPGWEDDLDRCITQHQMPGIRLHPNYHGYTLDDPRLSQLLKRATSAGRFVQIAVAMEDTRTQHPMMQVPDVDLSPLPKLVRDIAGATVQLLNGRLRWELLEQMAKTPGILFDSARVDGTDGVAMLARAVPLERVMFGTHAPFLIPEAALIRVHEADFDEEQLRSVLSENARGLSAQVG
jgi:predicted TIM-barrel fold metal-dependent hydrolase